MPQNGYPSTGKTEFRMHFKSWLLALLPFLLGNYQKPIQLGYEENGNFSGAGYQNMSWLEHNSLNLMYAGF